MDKASRASEQPRRHTNPEVRKEEEQALQQIISGIIPEWQEANDKEKRGTIEIMKLWTEDMMNRARIQLKNWMEKKNEHRAYVQQRWDNRGIMNKAFQKWKSLIRGRRNDKDQGQGYRDVEGNKEKTYGIKDWGRVRTIPRIHKQVKNFLPAGIG
eukprot:6180140-Pleurochrysis_carterae.AAC.4